MSNQPSKNSNLEINLSAKDNSKESFNVTLQKPSKIKNYLDDSLMLVTALAPKIGYDNAAKIAKRALKNNTRLKEEAIKSGLIKEKDYNLIVDPKKMIYPK